MDAKPIEKLAIMFADVAGSTKLYDTLGDVAAERIISDCITAMLVSVEHHGGTLIKTIGDEIMCRFDDVGAALAAGCEIQQKVKQVTLNNPQQPKVRVGLQYGPCLFKQNDVFGDTVNVAARMAGLAVAGQIITTQETMSAAGQSNIHSRCINALEVKGKQEAIQIHEVLWDPDDGELTTLLSSGAKTAKPASVSVLLKYQEQEQLLCQENPEILLGRGAQCGFEVIVRTASRVHARVLLKRDKAVIVDQSTNGTYVKVDSGEELFVHKEEMVLVQAGQISLGAPSMDEDPNGLVYYRCQYNAVSN